MTAVKICGITRISDALAAVEAGAQFIGFNFWAASPRYIDPDRAVEIAKALPPYISVVGIFVNEKTPGAVRKICTLMHARYAQLHGEESAEFCRAVGIPIIKAFPAKTGLSPREVAAFPAEAILLDTPSRARGGTGRVFDWKVAEMVRPLVGMLFLAGGLNAGNVGDAIRRIHPDVVDVCSAVETRPGKKDLAKMRAFIAAVCRAEEKKNAG